MPSLRPPTFRYCERNGRISRRWNASRSARRLKRDPGEFRNRGRRTLIAAHGPQIREFICANEINVHSISPFTAGRGVIRRKRVSGIAHGTEALLSQWRSAPIRFIATRINHSVSRVVKKSWVQLEHQFPIASCCLSRRRII